MSKNETTETLNGCLTLIFVFFIIYWFNPYGIFGNDDNEEEIEIVENRPSEQIFFEENIEEFIRKYDEAPNDIKKSDLYVDSRLFQSSYKDTFGYKVNDWVGKIETIFTEKGGEKIQNFKIKSGSISYEIGEKIYIKSNCSATTINTTIIRESDLYKSISNFAEGDYVSFSGTFFRSDDDRKDRCYGKKIQYSNKKPGFEENSLTESGYMSYPNFLFRFSNISSLN